MRSLLTITLILACTLNIRTQEVLDFDSIPFIQALDTLAEHDPIDLDLQPISKEAFQAYTGNCQPVIENEPESVYFSGDIITIQTTSSTIEIHKTRSPYRPYNYHGYIPALQCHFVS